MKWLYHSHVLFVLGRVTHFGVEVSFPCDAQEIAFRLYHPVETCFLTAVSVLVALDKI